MSIDSIVNDLEIAHHYGTRYLVVHCGKHVGEGEEEGKRLMIDAVNEVLDRFDGDTLLCLENTVGAGTELGWRVEELLEIFDGIEAKEKAGFCFDTCHAFAAGWLDFDNFEAFVDSFTQPDYLSRLAVIHLNDSKIPFDGRRDRHELLGKGEIGSEPAGGSCACLRSPSSPSSSRRPSTKSSNTQMKSAKRGSGRVSNWAADALLRAPSPTSAVRPIGR